jgi:hypothetical protein
MIYSITATVSSLVLGRYVDRRDGAMVGEPDCSRLLTLELGRSRRGERQKQVGWANETVL